MSAKWKKGQKCWFIRPAGMWPTISSGVITSSTHADSVRVRRGSGGAAVITTQTDIDVFRTEEEACRALIRRLEFRITLLRGRLTDIRYEQGPMEISK